MGRAQASDVLCRKGNGAFKADFEGVTVNVAPPTNDKLANRICSATLSWGSQTLIIANHAAEIDLDMFEVDPGLGVPVAAFQVKDSDTDCCMAYKIYSLEQPPRLLRSLHGGNSFRGADTNLDGQVEIWTDDAAAVDNFVGLRAAQLQFPPTCVLRFEHGRLVDVSSEFALYFDAMIAKLRAQISPAELERFKLGAGTRGLPEGLPGQQESAIQTILSVRKAVLELVWAYLYSGREKQAWQTLTEMWPPRDVDRTRQEIMQMRARGIQAQVDAVSKLPAPTHLRHSKVYESPPQPARPIMIRFYPAAEDSDLRGRVRVGLVVDSAGKVWSVKVSSGSKLVRNSLQRSTANWKFIPAYFDGHPVASRIRMAVSLQQ